MKISLAPLLLGCTYCSLNGEHGERTKSLGAEILTHISRSSLLSGASGNPKRINHE